MSPISPHRCLVYEDVLIGGQLSQLDRGPRPQPKNSSSHLKTITILPLSARITLSISIFHKSYVPLPYLVRKTILLLLMMIKKKKTKKRNHKTFLQWVEPALLIWCGIPTIPSTIYGPISSTQHPLWHIWLKVSNLWDSPYELWSTS